MNYYSIERLTRFKYPKYKRERVYKEILTKHTIQPKISLKTFYSYPQIAIDELVKLIWNTSVGLLTQIPYVIQI